MAEQEPKRRILKPTRPLTAGEEAEIYHAWGKRTAEQNFLYGPHGEETPGRVSVDSTGKKTVIKFSPYEAPTVTFNAWDSTDENRRPLRKLGIPWVIPEDQLERFRISAETIPPQTFPRPEIRPRRMSPAQEALHRERVAQHLMAKERVAEHAFPGGSAVSLAIGIAVEGLQAAWDNVSAGVKYIVEHWNAPPQQKGKK